MIGAIRPGAAGPRSADVTRAPKPGFAALMDAARPERTAPPRRETGSPPDSGDWEHRLAGLIPPAQGDIATTSPARAADAPIVAPGNEILATAPAAPAEPRATAAGADGASIAADPQDGTDDTAIKPQNEGAPLATVGPDGVAGQDTEQTFPTTRAQGSGPAARYVIAGPGVADIPAAPPAEATGAAPTPPSDTGDAQAGTDRDAITSDAATPDAPARALPATEPTAQALALAPLPVAASVAPPVGTPAPREGKPARAHEARRIDPATPDNTLDAAVAAPSAPVPQGVAAPGSALAPNPPVADGAAPLPLMPGSDAQVLTHLLGAAHDGASLDRLARDITASAGDGPLRFALRPEALGTLGVEIRQGDDGAAIRLTTASHTAHALMDEARPQLLAQAHAQGVRIAHAAIEYAPDGGAASNDAGGGSARRDQPPPPASAFAPSGTADEIQPTPAPRPGARYA